MGLIAHDISESVLKGNDTEHAYQGIIRHSGVLTTTEKHIHTYTHTFTNMNHF